MKNTEKILKDIDKKHKKEIANLTNFDILKYEEESERKKDFEDFCYVAKLILIVISIVILAVILLGVSVIGIIYLSRYLGVS